MMNSDLLVEITDRTSALNLDDLFGKQPARLEVDVGCGKGGFLIARAKAYPDVSFLGIDKRLMRARKVERKALREGLKNVRLIHSEAGYVVKALIPARSVSTYYLFFPDPWPKRRHHRRRLFDKEFMDAIVLTLLKEGCIHVISDHAEYFKIIRSILETDSRFAEMQPFMPEQEEQTEFQKVFLEQNKPVHSCSFRKTSV